MQPETDDAITVAKCKTIREVPEEEWKQWVGEKTGENRDASFKLF